MPIKRILLVRHGQSLGNVEHSITASHADHALPLSEVGHAQARRTGTFLRGYLEEHQLGRGAPRRSDERIRLWYSPYKRAAQTAEHIREEIGDRIMDSRSTIELVEQQFGLFDGVPPGELPIRFPTEFAHYKKHMDFKGRFFARVPLGESRFDVALRVKNCFGTFHRDSDAHDVNTIIIVCHGVVIRAFLMQWFHHTPEWFDAEPNARNASVRLIESNVDKGYIHDGG